MDVAKWASKREKILGRRKLLPVGALWPACRKAFPDQNLER
jgi:hypothetical protein